ncbi:cell division protein FtsQ/DivIB [Deinococcus sp. Leaf326]|uniref:cell division protein FtsQ/DivIB n=1 Tax=Deinococcus sp. Leaf326 TaxID=1736338 RepID=UPI000AF5BB62|nr:FtsQ-type POTRA domain-containing protein [Deinococcus sp. Leaf326]
MARRRNAYRDPLPGPPAGQGPPDPVPEIASPLPEVQVAELEVQADVMVSEEVAPMPEDVRPRRQRRARTGPSLGERLRRVRPWVWWASGGSVVFVAALAASWLLLPVRTVTVSGNGHLSTAEVRRLAGLDPVLGSEFGWLYYGRWRARGLLDSPWVASARVTRIFPDQVSIEVTERRPFARWQPPGGEAVTLAEGGEVLPDGPTTGLPVLSGWGPDRLKTALTAARALSRYTVQSAAYTPSGVTVRTANGSVWSGDLNSLLKYAGSISMYPNQHINIYPWGVSVQE